MPSLKVVLRFQQQLSRSSETEGYLISVIKSPGRGWGGPFLPEGLDDAHINAVRQVYRGYVERQQTGPRLPLDERSWEILRAAGSQLFRVLPETVQARLHQAQSIAQEQGKSLEIVLAFDQTARPLLSLPWELLHNPAGRYFFALRGGGITRQLWLPTAPSANKSFRPQAILGVWAEPEGGAGLSARAAYSPAPGHDDEITWLAGADTLDQMKPALDSGRYDGLHIVAHGRADENWSDFSLALVAADGRPRWISPDQLAVFLSDYPQIRFVYLDVCASTVSGNAESRADYLPGGLASSLLGMGVTAVVAMQDNISQEAAGLTAQVFYRELSQGADLAQAMTRARRAVRLQLDDPIHWSVPAIYNQHKPEDERSFGSLRAADWLLDNVRRLF
ncbi:MAG: CHAT domain-containing protein, partial [Chloroflexi bacterium]|nr:CHAT domain-containing protein [Chloroflexota bacterium]